MQPLRHLRERPAGRGRREAARADRPSSTVRRRRRRRSPSIWRRSSASTGGEPRRPTATSSSRRFVDFVEAAARRAADDPRLRGRSLGRAPNLLDLIDPLAVGSHGLPLLLVTLARPEFLDARERVGWRLSSYTSFTLGPLDERDAARARGPPPRRAGPGGRGGEDRGGEPALHRAARRDHGGRRRRALPTSIRGLVAARLDALPQRDRALLLDAAVVGKVFWYDALLALSPRSGPRQRARRARAPRPDPARGRLDHREPAAVLVHARSDPRRRVRAPAARRPCASPRGGRAVLRAIDRSPRARRSARSHAIGATPATSSVRSRSSRAPLSRRSGAGRRTTRPSSTARRSSSCPRTTRSSGARSGAGSRSRARRLPSRRRQTAGKSAGVTSPTISSIESMRCWPSRLECSRTISSFGALVHAVRAHLARRRPRRRGCAPR